MFFSSEGVEVAGGHIDDSRMLASIAERPEGIAKVAEGVEYEYGKASEIYYSILRAQSGPLPNQQAQASASTPASMSSAAASSTTAVDSRSASAVSLTGSTLVGDPEGDRHGVRVGGVQVIPPVPTGGDHREVSQCHPRRSMVLTTGFSMGGGQEVR